MPINVKFPPSEGTIDLIEAFIHGPGYVDLSDISFEALSSEMNRSKKNTTAMDIAVFKLPHHCRKLSCAGIGLESKFGEPNVCCTQRAIEQKECDASNYGRLIYSDDKFRGVTRTVTVPPQVKGNISPEHLEDPKINLYASGLYVLAFANCNEKEGRVVQMQGGLVWKSEHGYLPGNLFRVYHLLIFLFCCWTALFICYAGSVFYKIKKGNEPLRAELWIALTIFAGFLEIMIEITSLTITNRTGHTRIGLATLGTFITSFKQIFARCVAVMLAMGAGMTTFSSNSASTSEPKTSHVIRFGAIYLVISLVLDSSYTSIIRSASKTQRITEKTVVMLEFDEVIFALLFMMDCVFYVWVFRALKQTTVYLSTMNRGQESLQRYRHLRTIARAVMSAIVIIVIFSLVQSRRSPVYAKKGRFVLDILTDFTYLACFTSVAYLWRPRWNGDEDYAPLAQAISQDEGAENDLYLELTDAGPVPLADVPESGRNSAGIL